MAKISLRSYNREIENMVDQGQLDEAIAHCRHILNIFPKNLETYRLLGKAFLEARRYNEATDIFERLLSSVPNDFVAHVGMSIINDEQNDLDAAIWHMQRAFEVQPSNAAIQSELQRLFGRRDGVEPPKIRLTRGALAHMYVQGELYPQAISEIKAVLEEDGERQDMQVLLVLAYFRAGQKNEAADMCSQLLRRYPYCFDANRVLVELLPETEHGESPQVARQRVNELDPYATFASGSVFQNDEVADAAVSLERLEWDGQPVDSGQEWRDSLGIERGEQATADEEEPDWLKAGLTSGSFIAPTASEEPASVSSDDDDIPDFLREAGWGKDTGTFQEGTSSFAASDESSEEPALAEGDLPDWIKAMAPTDADVADSSSQDLTEDDVPDWLQGLGSAQDAPAEEGPLEEGDLPDWLAAMKPAEETQAEDELAPEPVDEEDLPDWLKSVQPEEEISEQETPAEEPTLEMPLETPEEPAQEMTEARAESLSDWQTGEEVPEAPVEFDATDTGTLGTSADEQDDAIAWLESLAAKHGAKPEELVTNPEERDETEPDWVQQARAVKDQGVAETPISQEESLAEPSEDLPDFLADMLAEPKEEAEPETAPTDQLGTSAGEQDDAIAWLESLAAKHGAKPEELVTDPEARKETAPDWVQKAAEEGSAQTPIEAKQEALPEEPQEGIPDWIEPAAEEEGALAPELEDTQPNKSVSRTSADETGIWLRDLEEAEGVTSEQEPAAEVEASDADEDVPDWLRGLEAESTQTEAVSSSEEQAQDLPDWLRSVEAEATETESLPAAPAEEETLEEEPSSLLEEETPELPDWLSESDTKALEAESFPAVSAEETPGAEAGPTSEEEAQEIPDWLSEVEAESVEEEQLPAPLSEEEAVPEAGQEVEFQAVEATAESEEPDFTDWLQSIETEEAGERVDQPVAEEATAEDVPSWLAGLEETQEEETTEGEPETPAVSADEDLPEWLRGEVEQEPLPAEPTAPTDWQPADVEAVPGEEAQEEPEEQPAPEPEPALEEPSEQVESPEPSEPVSEPESEPEPVDAVPSAALSSSQEPELAEAQRELTQGNLSAALHGYDKLIRKGRMLDEIIYDLREALYRYPVDVSILQALGDAYMRANRLQDALDAYTKAEELLR